MSCLIENIAKQPDEMTLSLQDKWNIATAFIVLLILVVVYAVYIRFMNQRELRQNLMFISNHESENPFINDYDHNFLSYASDPINFNDSEEYHFIPVNDNNLDNRRETNVDNKRRLFHILTEMGFSKELCEEAVETASNLDEALDYCEAHKKSSAKEHQVSSEQSNSIFVLYNPYDSAKKNKKKVGSDRNSGYEMVQRSDQVLNPIINRAELSDIDEDYPIVETLQKPTVVIRDYTSKPQVATPSREPIEAAAMHQTVPNTPRGNVNGDSNISRNIYDSENDILNYNKLDSNSNSNSSGSANNQMYVTPTSDRIFARSSDVANPSSSFTSESLNSSALSFASPSTPIRLLTDYDDAHISSNYDFDSKNIIKAGYLKKLSNGINRVWAKRWFFIYDGKLYYTHKESEMNINSSSSKWGKSSDASSDIVNISRAVQVANLVISTVKEVSKFEFQIISPGRRGSGAISGGVYDLQGDNEYEVSQWISCIRQQICNSLSNSPTNESLGQRCVSSPTVNALLFVPPPSVIRSIYQFNRFCIDCNASNPEWASLNLCVMMCIECSGIHRSMGSHISKVRSLTLDMWTQSQIQLLQCIGNEKANMIWESAILENSEHYLDIKPTQMSSREVKETFIQNKYIKKLYISKANDKNQNLLNCVKSRDLYKTFKCLVQGDKAAESAPCSEENSHSALHEAVEQGYVELVELLCLWNSDLNVIDGLGRTPIDISKIQNNNQIINTLQLYSTKSVA